MKQFASSGRIRCMMEEDGLLGFHALNKINFTHAEDPIEDHIHPDAIELCYIAKGSQVYAVNGKHYRVGAGMVFISYANEVHSTDTLKQEKGVELYYMIIDTINHAHQFLGLNSSESQYLMQQLNSLNRCFYVGMGFKSRLDELQRLHLERPPMYQLLLRSHACLMVDDLSRASNESQPALTQDICDVLSIMEDRLYGTPPDIAELAALVHLSVPHFKQKFRRQIGMPPMAYLMRRRIELSCELLTEGRSITQTAYDLGFSSSQHFSTTFHRYIGESPSTWKRK